MKRIDPLTGEEFIPKKISQKYASPSNRIKHNNQKASKLRQEKASLDKHVHKNNIILREIFKERVENHFNCDWLEGKGFRFDSTNHQIKYKGAMRNCVYEFILIEIENENKIEVIKNGRF
jgi:hypothetical protein